MTTVSVTLIEHCWAMRSGLENFINEEVNDLNELNYLNNCITHISNDDKISLTPTQLACPVQILSKRLAKIVEDICVHSNVNTLRILEILCICEGLLPQRKLTSVDTDNALLGHEDFHKNKQNTIVTDDMESIEESLAHLGGIGTKRKSPYRLMIEEEEAKFRRFFEYNSDEDEDEDQTEREEKDRVAMEIREDKERTRQVIAAVMEERRNREINDK